MCGCYASSSLSAISMSMMMVFALFISSCIIWLLTVVSVPYWNSSLSALAVFGVICSLVLMVAMCPGSRLILPSCIRCSTAFIVHSWFLDS